MPSSQQLEDPRVGGDPPPFSQPGLEYPGLKSEMTPRPDYEETSYQGHGRLQE